MSFDRFLPNKKRADSDPSFEVSFQGIARADWALVLDHLQDWHEKYKSDESKKELSYAIEAIAGGLQSHVLNHVNGYTLGSATPRPVSDAHKEALRKCRARYDKELAEMEQTATRLEMALRARKKRGEKISKDAAEFLATRCKGS